MKKKNIISILTTVALLFAIHTVIGSHESKPAETKAVSNQQKLMLSRQSLQKSPAGSSASYQLEREVLSSGATKGASASFSLLGTLGQPAVGYGESESFKLSHGFWQEFGGGGTCCNGDGMRGDVDGDASITVGDVVWLVDYVFFGGDPPVCEDDPGVFPEADADGDGSVTVGDVVLLVDYVFFGGPPPAPCP